MIHESAIISPVAKIGKSVKIGAFCVVGDQVAIGDGTELKSHVVLDGFTTIGKNNVIFPFASIGHRPQDLKYKGESSKVIIGDNNTIREYVTIQPGTQGDRMKTMVGDSNLLMVGVHIAHDCIVGNNTILANYVSLGGHVIVGDYARIGGLSGVLQRIKIGKHAVLGGLSGLMNDLIPYGLASNERATLDGVNLVGMNRGGMNKQDALDASDAVKEIFQTDGLFEQNVQKIKNKYKNNQIVQDIIKFLTDQSKNGFCKLK